MSHIPPSTFTLARDTVGCNSCFAAGKLERAGIQMPQPFSVGRNYWKAQVRVVVAGINPGAGSKANYKQARKEALDRFVAGDDPALIDYFQNAEVDVPKWGNRRFLDRLHRLELALADIAIGNIALCATAGNRYPSWMLSACFERQTMRWFKELDPHTVLLMGSATEPFIDRVQAGIPAGRAVLKMAHFAHREGKAVEEQQCSNVRARLAALGGVNPVNGPEGC